MRLYDDKGRKYGSAMQAAREGERVKKIKGSIPASSRDALTSEEVQRIAQLYRTYYGTMKRAVSALVTGPDVEDLIQETVLCMMRSIDHWRGLSETQLYAYTYHAARNHAIDYLRAQKKTLPIPSEAADETVWDNSPDARLIRKENIEALYRTLDRLSDRDRSLLLMKYQDHMPDWEIAALLGVKPESVSSLVSRARKRVLKLAEKEGTPHDESI